MMVKNQKTAPPATESEPDATPQEIAGEAVVPETVSPIQIPPKVLEQAKALGIDLKQVVDWAQSVEARFNFIAQNLEAMQPLVELSKRVQEAQANPQAPVANPQPGGFNLGALMQFLPQLLGGGGGDSELASLGNQYGKLVLKQAIENVGKPSIEEKIGEAVLEGFIRKKSGEAAKVLTES